MVLAHNHVKHNEWTPVGINRFRAFFCPREACPRLLCAPADGARNWASTRLEKHVQHYDSPRKRAKRFREYAANNPWLAQLGERARVSPNNEGQQR